MEREAENIRKSLGFANMVCDGGNGIVLNHELVSLEPLLFIQDIFSHAPCPLF